MSLSMYTRLRSGIYTPYTPWDPDDPGHKTIRDPEAIAPLSNPLGAEPQGVDRFCETREPVRALPSPSEGVVRPEAREGGEGEEVASGLLQEAPPHEDDAVGDGELMRQSKIEALPQPGAAVGDTAADGGSRSVLAAGAEVEGSEAAGSGLEHEGKVRDSVSRDSLKPECVAEYAQERAAQENQSPTAISEASDSAQIKHSLTSEQQQQRFEQEVASAAATAAAAAAAAPQREVPSVQKAVANNKKK